VFLLDSSGSVGEPDFVKQKNFVNSIVNNFDVSSTGIQVGIVTFSWSPQPEFTMAAYHTKASLLSAIAAITYTSGGTNTAHALDYVRTHSFTQAAGDRSDVADILIVMTDGRSSSTAATTTAARLIHTANIETFAIGIGTGVSQTELTAIASHPQNVITVSNFDALKTIIAEVYKAICKLPSRELW
jgi:hypothetical protein